MTISHDSPATPYSSGSPDTPSTSVEPGAPAQRPGRRWPLWLRALLAALLLACGLMWVLGEHVVAQGPVLITITREHGVDLRDLLAAPLFLGAAALLFPRRLLWRR